MGLIDRALVDVQKRFETMQRRMAPGSLGGRTESASPVSPLARGVATPQTRLETGSSLPVFFSHTTTTSVATGGAGTTLEWAEPDDDITHNVGGAFEYTSATVITVTERSLVAVLCSVLFVGEDGDQRQINVSGPEWGAPQFFRMPSIAAAGDNTTVVMATGVYCTAGDTITIAAGHDATGAVPISEGYLTLIRVALL